MNLIVYMFFLQGLSSMGRPDYTEAEFKGLCLSFKDPKLKDHVLWKKFVSALEDPSKTKNKSERMYVKCMYVCI